jgi:alpha-amylase
MPSVCFYFQVHQPFRLREYTFFDIGHDHYYENEKLNREVMNKVADKCYIPTNTMMLDLIKKHKGKFRISYSISGTAIEQFEKYRPDVLKSFIELSKTGCVEFLSETYYHSLSYLYDKYEFKRQVEKHRELIKKYFKQTPKVFRNTELIYNNEIAKTIEDMGYKAILCEGVDRLLRDRTPNFVYRAPNCHKIKSLLKNYRLSDDIAFRFSDPNWTEHPLSAAKFAGWVHTVAGNGELVNLFMDYETFGEHQWASSGIFEFLNQLPTEILKHKDFDFKTPSEVADTYPIRDDYDAHHLVSWADTERDLSAWLGNSLQNEAIERIYSFKEKVFSTGRQDIIDTWAKLLTSDHFYYMCTKYWADGDVHKYFSPYQSPYDAYIFYMNALTDMEYVLNEISKHPHRESNPNSVSLQDLKIDALTASPAKPKKETADPLKKNPAKSSEKEMAISISAASSTASIKEDVLKKVKSLTKKGSTGKPKATRKPSVKKVAKKEVKKAAPKEKVAKKPTAKPSKTVVKKKI